MVGLAVLAGGCFSGLRQQPRHDAGDSPDSFMVTGMSDNDGAAPDRALPLDGPQALPPDAPPDLLAPDACQPLTCASAGANCGTLSNGCAGMLDCGGCPGGQVCGAAGPNKCGVGPCTPKTCAALMATCGNPSDGCGKALGCGMCQAPETCGGGGTPFTCGCTKESNTAFCNRLGKNCDQVSGADNCGQERTTSCGSCPAGQTCGADATPNVCWCPKESDTAFCARLGKACGQVSGTDSCSQPRTVASCGSCMAPDTCGGGGTPNACGCTKTTCAAANANCGSISDGCGGSLPCGGMCTAPQTCGGGGANRCGCAPSSAGDTQYVDPAKGTDDVQHGGGTGACAYKTITFALTHAGGDVVLFKADYQAPAETFPLVLNGSQKLLCNGAVLRGSGGTNKDTVEFQGTANGLDQCMIDGQQAGTMCVYVSHPSASGSVHTISKCDVQKCGTTAVYVAAGDLAISASNIHEAPLDGILWYGTTGSMTGNQFSGNTRDISCGTATSGAITGSGNARGGGPTVCYMCANCPF
jgi:hypothetical protein